MFNLPLRAVLLVLFLLQLRCAPEGPHKPIMEPPEAQIRPQSVGGEGHITFEQVKDQVFVPLCGRCHPAIMQPDWRRYEAAFEFAKNGKLYNRVVESKTMPLVGSPEAMAIRQDQRDMIAHWIRQGAPQ